MSTLEFSFKSMTSTKIKFKLMILTEVNLNNAVL